MGLPVTYLLLQGSAAHLPLRDASVQTCITSPPFWGLRQYAGEQRLTWGGDPEHEHEWVATARSLQTGGVSEKQATHSGNDGTGFTASASACACACGAWYGALGLEPTPEAYVAHMVEVFREVRRVCSACRGSRLRPADAVRAEDFGDLEDAARACLMFPSLTIESRSRIDMDATALPGRVLPSRQ